MNSLTGTSLILTGYLTGYSGQILTPSTPAVPNRCCSFRHSGAHCQSARMSKITNTGLDRYWKR